MHTVLAFDNIVSRHRVHSSVVLAGVFLVRLKPRRLCPSVLVEIDDITDQAKACKPCTMPSFFRTFALAEIQYVSEAHDMFQCKLLCIC